MVTKRPGDDIFAEIQIRNSGSVDHAFTAKMFLNGNFLAIRDISLASGQTGTVTQSFSIPASGEWNFETELYDDGRLLDTDTKLIVVAEEAFGTLKALSTPDNVQFSINGFSGTIPSSATPLYIDLPTGSYSWTASKPGYRTKTGTYNVLPRIQTFSIVLEKEVVSVDGIVYDEVTGTGIQGAKARLRLPFQDVARYERTTNSSGFYSFQDIEADNYVFEVGHPSYELFSRSESITSSKRLNPAYLTPITVPAQYSLRIDQLCYSKESDLIIVLKNTGDDLPNAYFRLLYSGFSVNFYFDSILSGQTETYFLYPPSFPETVAMTLEVYSFKGGELLASRSISATPRC